ncbi:primosomal protein N' [Virgibacillus sp. W0181]|uniref:primosomal protein N' n=1 Tax=Virgibacillus sp. W0181 TaxID=3391581 RepID=UPI003F46BAB9
MTIANVIVDVPASQVNQTYDYSIPLEYRGVLKAGMRVVIPFGPRKITGFVIGTTDHSDYKNLKEILEVLDLTPVLTPELLKLGKWLADDTISLYITAYQAMLPQALKSSYKKEIVRLKDSRLSDELEQLFAGRDVLDYHELTDAPDANDQYRHLQQAIQDGDIYINYLVKSRAAKKYLTMIKPAKEMHILEEAYANLAIQATKQKQLLSFFITHPVSIEQSQLMKTLDISQSVIKSLLDKSLLTKEKKEVYRNPYEGREFTKTEKLSLTKEQSIAIAPIKDSIAKDEHHIFLLHGVTGSGKTEVYLQSIEDVLNKGKEAIVLVPEISLTPQMVKRFKGRFGSNVAVMHSALSPGEKYDEWRRIHRKEVQVVVGARSAIFAPFENLGIIIMDEEHETSYKQEDNPRYHARDVAIKRAESHHCPIVLGSATPTLESNARARKGVYKLVTLSERTNQQEMPHVEVIDMRQELHAGNRTMFSRTLVEKMKERISHGEQIVLLLNRRGYSTFALCRDCGHVQECPHCDIALTYHKNNHQLKCHYCAYEEPMPSLCPNCESNLIRFFGTGTQRVEEALSSVIPEATVIRMDVDTTRRKGSHERLLSDFGNKKGNILLGTQMIAKGLDFENVTLVGVLTADSMLHLPDFRSSEKTFQLLTQVSGRAGRHELVGEVVIQTYTPDHYSVQLASQYDYDTFYFKEMATRKLFRYPPYVFLTLITIAQENKVYVIQTAQEIAKLLMKHIQKDTVILGPTPSPIARIKDKYRYQLMIKYRNEPRLKAFIKKIMEHYAEEIRKNDLQITVDVQPYQLM